MLVSVTNLFLGAFTWMRTSAAMVWMLSRMIDSRCFGSLLLRPGFPQQTCCVFMWAELSGLSALRLGLVPCLVRLACRTVCTVSALCIAFVFFLSAPFRQVILGRSFPSVSLGRLWTVETDSLWCLLSGRLCGALVPMGGLA